MLEYSYCIIRFKNLPRSQLLLFIFLLKTAIKALVISSADPRLKTDERSVLLGCRPDSK